MTWNLFEKIMNAVKGTTPEQNETGCTEQTTTCTQVSDENCTESCEQNQSWDQDQTQDSTDSPEQQDTTQSGQWQQE